MGIVILMTVIEDSRGYLVFQVAGLYVIAANHHKNYFLKYLIPTLIIAFVVIKFGKPFFHAMETFFKDGYDAFINEFLQRVAYKSETGESVISSFTHPIVSLEASLVHSGYDVELRYFRDIYNAFVLLLPNELLGLDEPEMLLMEQNTILLQGRAYGIAIPALLGYFSYAGNVIGVFVGSYLYGLIGVALMKLFLNIYRAVPGSIVLIYLMIFAYGYFVFRGVPSQVLNDNFIYFVVIGFLLFTSKLKILKI